MAKEKDKKQIEELSSPPQTEETETKESVDLFTRPTPKKKKRRKRPVEPTIWPPMIG